MRQDTRIKLFLAVAVVVAAASGLSVAAHAAEDGAFDVVQVVKDPPFPPMANRDKAASPDKLHRSYEQLDIGLNAIILSPEPFAEAERRGFRTRYGLIQVMVLTEEQRVAELEQWLRERGAAFVLTFQDLVQAFVTVQLLPELNAHPAVRTVRKPFYFYQPEPPKNGSERPESKIAAYTSEALPAIGVGAWHTAGHTGSGIKVGVIDSQFYGWDTLSGTELPGSSKLHYNAPGGAYVEQGSVHGTGCAEVIHDIVPDASLYLGHSWSLVDMADSTTWMKNQGVKVISMSMGLLAWGPNDGTGYLADVINSFTSSGGVFVVSAGNLRVAHWQGQFNDYNSDGWLDFTQNTDLNIFTDGSNYLWFNSGETIFTQLIWNQWSSPSTDFDYSLWGSTDGSSWSKVAESDNYQTGQSDQWPIEEFSHQTTAAGYYGLAIQHYSGSANGVDLELITRRDGDPLDISVPQGSIAVPCDTASAICVAALDAVSPFPLEFYSSAGPTSGSGGSISGGSVKPDLSAYANVSTASYGARSSGYSFNGTSAACPHVAGAAALVLGANSGWSSSQVRNYLQTNAVDMGSSGKDNDYGYGRLKLGSPSGGGGGGGSTTCTPNSTTLCLNGGRFKVQTTWKKANGQSGTGQAVSLTNDTGYFWFFNSANVEMVLKVLNGCGVNNNYWVYAGGLTNVKVTMTVTDTSNGTVKTYNNPQSTPFQPIQDTGAFHTCP